jgi:hypothetical protein
MDRCYEDSLRAKQMDEKMKKEELHKVLFYLHIYGIELGCVASFS